MELQIDKAKKYLKNPAYRLNLTTALNMSKTIKIKVIPRSSFNEIIELPDGSLKIKLTAPPVDGEANKKLIDFLSKEWKITKSKIKIIKGEKSKEKIVEIV